MMPSWAETGNREIKGRDSMQKSKDAGKWKKNCIVPLRMANIEGFRPEWCISTIYHAWDTPFWLGTLNIHSALSLSSLPTVALKAVPMFVRLNTDYSWPWMLQCKNLRMLENVKKHFFNTRNYYKSISTVLEYQHLPATCIPVKRMANYSATHLPVGSAGWCPPDWAWWEQRQLFCLSRSDSEQSCWLACSKRQPQCSQLMILVGTADYCNCCKY